VDGGTISDHPREAGVACQMPGPHLTERQRQVVGLVAAGLTDREIGMALSISPRTVRMHCDVVRHRLGADRRRLIPARFRQCTGLDPLSLLEELHLT
jgi:DNA-binding CsgD family transcriptional regulator